MLSQAQFGSTLSSHILVAPTGYQNSWNIAAENSEAPDVQMIGDLVPMLQGYGNVNSNHIRVLGVSNGGSLANRIFAENRNPGIDIVSSVVSQLNTFQFRSGQFFKPSGVTDPSRPDGGYDVAILPLTTRKYLSVANVNDPIIPYEGGASRVGLTLLPAETAAYNIAQLKGYSGSLLTLGTEIGSGVSAITEFEYLSGEVVHLKGSAGHQLNSAQKSYITEFFAVPEPSAVVMINVSSGTQTQTAAGYPLLSGSTPVVKTGAGTLVVDQANTLTGSTGVQQGTLQLANGSALGSSKVIPVAGGTVSLAPYVQTTVGGLAPNAGGLVNLGNGLVTVASGLTPTELVTAILAGRGDGSWTGTTGITSSVAAADLVSGIPRAVGWLDNGDGSVTAAFAAPGDTNIDWQVDVLDAGNFLTFDKYDTGLPATWLEGDFNYDGVVDVLDASDFFNTALYDTGNYNTPAGAAGSVAAVPEPSAVSLAAVFGAWLVVRRWRRWRSEDSPANGTSASIFRPVNCV